MESLTTIRVFLLAALLQGCGLTTAQDKLATVADSAEIKSGSLTGIVRDLDGREIDLSAGAGKIQVLIFVSETCSVCRTETRALVQDRATRGIPLNVDFLSIVIGAVAKDAADWKTSLGANWSVAIDPNDALFRQYCPLLQTPCLILRNPFLNQYKSITGEHSISEWENFTGAWIY